MDGPFTICHQFYNRMSNTVGTAETAYTNCAPDRIKDHLTIFFFLRKPELIQECPSDQAYDVCLTNIEQKGERSAKLSKFHKLILGD